ncbi:MAG TPA: DNA repair protein [Roseiflexaceae bacterium]|nr:DNA repair protein [Roseiflexaceae bacterium]
MDLATRLLETYQLLEAHFGHEPHWWPIVTEDPPFEVLVGAVLVQQTRWQTVEAAVRRLQAAGLLHPEALAQADTAALAELIRPCAFHTQKAPGLQAICRHLLGRHGGSVRAMLGGERQAVRAELLALPRIGKETADTIMLYAGGHPLFVVDAYTRRLFARLGLAPGFDFARAPYDAIQQLIEGALAKAKGQTLNAKQDTLPTSCGHADGRDGHGAGVEVLAFSLQPVAFFWRFHALIVEGCIHHCLASRPRCAAPGLRPAFVDPRKCAGHCVSCAGCPLRPSCAYQTLNAER